MLGWVRASGSVSTCTSGTVSFGGIEIVNGSEGTVNRIEGGSGVGNVAMALTRSRLGSEKI